MDAAELDDYDLPCSFRIDSSGVVKAEARVCGRRRLCRGGGRNSSPRGPAPEHLLFSPPPFLRQIHVGVCSSILNEMRLAMILMAELRNDVGSGKTVSSSDAAASKIGRRYPIPM